jgi:hypothetical protein
MTVVAKLKCRAGRHSGEWSNPGSHCEIVRICLSCGRREERNRHTWGQFGFVQTDGCDLIRRCARCGSTESRSSHEWGPWIYLNGEFTSPQTHTCRRCGLTERTAYTLR